MSSDRATPPNRTAKPWSVAGRPETGGAAESATTQFPSVDSGKLWPRACLSGAPTVARTALAPDGSTYDRVADSPRCPWTIGSRMLSA